jgi:soluble lytic murein transglycosylase-like protein
MPMANVSPALSAAGTPAPLKAGAPAPAAPQKDALPAPVAAQSLFDAGNPSVQSILSILMTLTQVLLSSMTAGDAAKTPSGAVPTPAKTAAPPASTPAPAAPAAGGGGGADSKLGPGAAEGLKKFQAEIENASRISGVPANLIAGMIWQESRGNLAAVSVNGGNGLTDTGLMQVNPNTYKDMQTRHPELQGRDNLADTQTNILAGAFYVKEQLERFGSIPLALRAYNSGPNGVDVNNPNATPAGTGDPTYVDKVMNFAKIIGSGGTLPP